MLGTVLQPIKFLKMGVGCPCLGGKLLMEVLNGQVFLTFSGPMDPLGLKIPCDLVRVGKLDVPLKIWIGGVNLEVATMVLMSHCVEPSLNVRLTSLGVWKMCTPLCSMSVMISFGSTIWRAPKVSNIFGTSYVTIWSIRPTVPKMIFGTTGSSINFCGNFPLVE